MNRVSVPQSTSQLAYSTAADIRQVTTALTGFSTRHALMSAELAIGRAEQGLKALRVSVRAMKRECVS